MHRAIVCLLEKYIEMEVVSLQIRGKLKAELIGILHVYICLKMDEERVNHQSGRSHL